jgi:hypothetical protein
MMDDEGYRQEMMDDEERVEVLGNESEFEENEFDEEDWRTCDKEEDDDLLNEEF